MLAVYVFAQSLLARSLDRLPLHRLAPAGRGEERGQASAEYALVLLGAAAVALLVSAWAVRTNRIGRLLDAVMDQVMSRVR